MPTALRFLFTAQTSPQNPRLLMSTGLLGCPTYISNSKASKADLLTPQLDLATHSFPPLNDKYILPGSPKILQSSLTPLFLSFPTCNLLENPVSSISKTCSGSDLFSLPPLRPLWHRPGLLKWSPNRILLPSLLLSDYS